MLGNSAGSSQYRAWRKVDGEKGDILNGWAAGVRGGAEQVAQLDRGRVFVWRGVESLHGPRQVSLNVPRHSDAPYRRRFETGGSSMASTRDYDRVAREQRRPGKEGAGGALDTRELVRLATLAASSHNTQPWKFRVREHSITVLPDFARRCPVVDPDDSHLFKSLGCAAENLVHAAAAQGYAADVSFDPTEEGVVARFQRSASAHASDVFRAIPRRQCTKTAYDAGRLAHEQLKLLEQAGQGAGVKAVILTARQQLESVIEYVTRGNEAQLTDPAFRKELVSWIRFNPGQALRTGDGLSGRTGGQPPLPTWLAKLVIGLILTPKAQADADAKNIRSSAAIAVFVAVREDKATWVEVGRAYERFALQATALDIRNAFVNQPIEVRSLRPQFESSLDLDGEHALLIVRIGRAPLAPFSLRRPLEEVMIT
jgi:hypothetical protein